MRTDAMPALAASQTLREIGAALTAAAVREARLKDIR